jgi:RNA polymerase sigma-70 factor (sigma-E family)
MNGQSAEAVLDVPADSVLAADAVREPQPVDVLLAPGIPTVPDVPGGVRVLHTQAGAADDIVTDRNDPAATGPPGWIRGDIAGTKLTAEGEPLITVTRPTRVAETLTAGAYVPEVRPAPSVWDADRVVTEIYHGEYKSLVRLAVLLVHDVPTAEEVVQDAFEAMHTAWRRLRDSEKALSYLRQAVVNKSRSVLRHRTVVDKNAPKPAPDEPSAEQGALALIERSAFVAALRTLPDRQREAIVLRYYADLSEADIAATMGISRGAVKSHTARAMAALKSILEQENS